MTLYELTTKVIVKIDNDYCIAHIIIFFCVMYVYLYCIANWTDLSCWDVLYVFQQAIIVLHCMDEYYTYTINFILCHIFMHNVI